MFVTQILNDHVLIKYLYIDTLREHKKLNQIIMRRLIGQSNTTITTNDKNNDNYNNKKNYYNC